MKYKKKANIMNYDKKPRFDIKQKKITIKANGSTL